MYVTLIFTKFLSKQGLRVKERTKTYYALIQWEMTAW